LGKQHHGDCTLAVEQAVPVDDEVRIQHVAALPVQLFVLAFSQNLLSVGICWLQSNCCNCEAPFSYFLVCKFVFLLCLGRPGARRAVIMSNRTFYCVLAKELMLALLFFDVLFVKITLAIGLTHIRGLK